MTPAAIIARLAECGFRAELTPAGPKLVRVRAGAVLPDRLKADAAANRDEVVAWLEGWRRCRECRAWVSHAAAADDLRTVCGRTRCPTDRP